jgi:hypothetical protein
VPRLPLASGSHDPYWDMDGKSARRARLRRKFVRYSTMVIGALLIAVVVTRLPAIDPQFFLTPEGRPFMAGALFALLGSTILIGLAWMRRTPNH